MNKPKPKYGQFFWCDITVEDANSLKDFYQEVVGWQVHPIGMKDGDESYDDYAMMIDEETSGGGVCTKRGVNSNIPSQWIMYINVENVEKSLNKALELGGKLIKEGRKKDGTYQYAIIQDPTGAVFGLGNAD